jgi:hAT family C-terminal dimerisation region
MNTKYPTMRRIARDYLAIQGSATPSERAFSSGGITGSARRSRLSTEIFEALQILKSAYRNGHITAAHQAGQHIDTLIMMFDDDSEGCDE